MAHHGEFDLGADLVAQIQADFVVPHLAKHAVGQQHLGLGDGHIRLGVDGLGDVAGADGAVKPAFIAGVHLDTQGQALHLVFALLSLAHMLVMGGQQLGPALLELGQVPGGGGDGLALGKQEVAGEAGLHIGGVADVAEVCDLFKQDNVHRLVLFLKSYQLSIIASTTTA